MEQPVRREEAVPRAHRDRQREDLRSTHRFRTHVGRSEWRQLRPSYSRTSDAVPVPYRTLIVSLKRKGGLTWAMEWCRRWQSPSVSAEAWLWGCTRAWYSTSSAIQFPMPHSTPCARKTPQRPGTPALQPGHEWHLLLRHSDAASRYDSRCCTACRAQGRHSGTTHCHAVSSAHLVQQHCLDGPSSAHAPEQHPQRLWVGQLQERIQPQLRNRGARLGLHTQIKRPHNASSHQYSTVLKQRTVLNPPSSVWPLAL